MIDYKAPNGKVHSIDEGDEKFLPDDCIKMNGQRPTPYHDPGEGTEWIEDTERKEADELERSTRDLFNTEHNSHPWKGKRPAFIKNRITTVVESMSMSQADKDILTPLLKQIATFKLR